MFGHYPQCPRFGKSWLPKIDTTSNATKEPEYIVWDADSGLIESGALPGSER